jgi:hypothetical protein
VRAWVLAAFLALTPACHDLNPRTAENVAAVAVSNALEAVLPALLDAYEREGMRAIEVSGTLDEAELRLAAVDLGWMLIWEAWGGVRFAHDQWATSVEGGNPDRALLGVELARAWCGLVAALAGRKVPEVRAVAIACEVST